MMKKVFVIACVFILLPLLVLGQQNTLVISGKVTDTEGNPLPGANIVLKDYNLGAATDRLGFYKFTVAQRFLKGQEVEMTARFIGYYWKTEKVSLSPGTVTKDFKLEEDVLEMDAVVVTGVAEETKKSMAPFSVDRVDKAQVELVPAVSAVQGLQGKIASVKVVKGSGRPGDGAVVNLRASTKINISGNFRSQQPLYIVDGVILAASSVDIDALDIETIEVVKGAAAASIYGSRAANGVIQIKTKRGNNMALGETEIKIRNEFGINQLANKIKLNKSHFYKINDKGEYLDADGNVVPYGEAAIDEDRMHDNPFPGKLYDNLDLYFDPGNFYTNTVSIGQHNPNTNYRLTFSNMQESGIMKFLNGYNRKNFRLNLDHKVSDDFQITASTYYMYSKRDDPQTAVNPFYGLMFINPNVNLEETDADGTYRIIPDSRTLEENPLYALRYAQEEDKRQRIMGSFSTIYSPTTWFNLEGNFSYDRSDRNSSEFYNKGYKNIDAVGLELGRYIKSNSYDLGINSSLTASFYKNFGDLTTKTKLRALYESDQYDYTYARGDELPVKDIKDLGLVGGEKIINSTTQEVKALGYYFISALSYQEKYIADVMIRRDGSSLFGEEQRWQTYYRYSLAWRLAQEPWWFTDKINEFKIRYSYGLSGGRPSFDAQYETFSVGSGVISKGTLGNKDLRPEQSAEQDIGLEMAFLNRFSLELVYATNKTKDQILLVPLAGYYGFGNQWQNAGTLESKTFEANLQSFIIKKRDMSWSAGLVFDRTRQEITEFNLPAYRTGPGNAFYIRANEKFGAMYGHKWMTSKDELKSHYVAETAGGWQNYTDQFDINDDGYLVPVGTGNTYQDGIAKDLWGTTVDLDGDGAGDVKWGLPLKYNTEKDGDFHKIGNVIPDFNLGFNTTFRWKGFTAYVLLDAQIGGDIYNNTRQWPYRELRHGDCDQAGKAEGKKKPFDYYAELYDVNAINSHFVEEGTYMKLRELTLRYTFDRAALNNLFGGHVARLFKRVTFGIVGRNLLTFTNYTGWDPEVGGGGDATFYRYDGFGYPQYRTFTGIFEVEF